MNTKTEHKRLEEPTDVMLGEALHNIGQLVASKRLVWSPHRAMIPKDFKSRQDRKRFIRALNRVAEGVPSMRSANSLLRHFGGKVDYTDEEKMIRAARKAYRDAVKDMRIKQRRYLALKGSFYGGRERVPRYLVTVQLGVNGNATVASFMRGDQVVVAQGYYKEHIMDRLLQQLRMLEPEAVPEQLVELPF